MAWTAPKTWTTEPLTSTDLNTHLRDNLNALKEPPTDTHKVDQVGNYTNALSGWRDVDATDFALTLTTTGGDVLVGLTANAQNSSGTILFDVEVDGVRWAGDDGLVYVASGGAVPLTINLLVTGLNAGAHTIKLVWSRSAGTANLFAGSIHGQFWAREV
jgi:hypothetical protein